MNSSADTNTARATLVPALLTAPVSRFRFELECLTPVDLGAFPGGTVRGQIGAALRRLACTTGADSCRGCPVKARCAYGWLFENDASSGPGFGSFQRPPRAYVFSVHNPRIQRYDEGDTLTIDVTLFGIARELLPHVAYAIEHIGLPGAGADRSVQTGRSRVVSAVEIRPDANQPFDLSACSDVAGEPAGLMGDYAGGRADNMPGAACSLHLRMDSPLQLRADGRLIRTPDLETIVRATLRRVIALETFYGDGAPATFPDELIPLASSTRIAWADTEWVSVERRSRRQGRNVPGGGLVGRILVDGVDPAIIPWLRLAEIVHIGKGCSMGLGKTRLTLIN